MTKMSPGTAQPVYLIMRPFGQVDGIEVPGDADTGALTFMSIAHYRIHAGDMFQASYKSPNASPIADDANLDLLFIANDTKSAHLIWQLAAGGDAELLFYEDTVTSNDGTELNEVNLKRISTKVAGETTFHTPTISDVGALLDNSLLPGGTGGNAGGTGDGFGSREWILKPNTKHLIRLTNRAGNPQSMSTILRWYEDG